MLNNQHLLLYLENFQNTSSDATSSSQKSDKLVQTNCKQLHTTCQILQALLGNAGQILSKILQTCKTGSSRGNLGGEPIETMHRNYHPWELPCRRCPNDLNDTSRAVNMLIHLEASGCVWQEHVKNI